MSHWKMFSFQLFEINIDCCDRGKAVSGWLGKFVSENIAKIRSDQSGWWTEEDISRHRLTVSEFRKSHKLRNYCPTSILKSRRIGLSNDRRQRRHNVVLCSWVCRLGSEVGSAVDVHAAFCLRLLLGQGLQRGRPHRRLHALLGRQLRHFRFRGGLLAGLIASHLDAGHPHTRHTKTLPQLWPGQILQTTSTDHKW